MWPILCLKASVNDWLRDNKACIKPHLYRNTQTVTNTQTHKRILVLQHFLMVMSHTHELVCFWSQKRFFGNDILHQHWCLSTSKVTTGPFGYICSLSGLNEHNLTVWCPSGKKKSWFPVKVQWVTKCSQYPRVLATMTYATATLADI